MFLDTKHAVGPAHAAPAVRTGYEPQACTAASPSHSAQPDAPAQFKDGHVTVLVATDPPGDHKDYHPPRRPYRTRRESGTVVPLVLPAPAARGGPSDGRRRHRLRATARIRPGEAELQRLTGARTPSGVPVLLAAPAEERPEGKGSVGWPHRSRAAAVEERPWRPAVAGSGRARRSGAVGLHRGKPIGHSQESAPCGRDEPSPVLPAPTKRRSL
ncbi:hypothetical protein GCM10017687_82060 [Streptomyces echinatus]